jgi:thermostable 8-oxoguanine DNA glycosylase
MIDPSDITDFNLNEEELEERLLFWICAAGKNGTTAARCLDKLMDRLGGYLMGPFESVRNKILTDITAVFRLGPSIIGNMEVFPEVLKSCGIGCYNAKSKSMSEVSLSGLDLKTCSPDELESIYGIGMKTSRCFILHSREEAEVAGLDTHMLKYLRAEGVKNVPKSTPSSKKEYKRLEQEVLKMAKTEGLPPAEFDLMIWNKFSVKSDPKM